MDNATSEAFRLSLLWQKTKNVPLTNLYQVCDLHPHDDIFGIDFEEGNKERQKICFLSSTDRKLNTGHSRLHCDFHEETRENVGPGSYNPKKIVYVVSSKAGYGGLASKTKRFKEVTTCTERGSFHVKGYHSNCEKPPTKLCSKFNKYGFNSNVERKTIDMKDYTPGFCYDITNAYKDHNIPFHHSFGGRTVIKPHVYVKCTPLNHDVCQRCESKPVGDYWFKGNNILCRPCFNLEWNNPQKFTRSQLQSLTKIRDCSHIHQHEGTTAAYPLMDKKDIRKQMIRECYFACYSGERKVTNVKPVTKPSQAKGESAKISHRIPKNKISSHIFLQYTKHQPLVNL